MEGHNEPLMDTRDPARGIAWQAEHCRRADAPATARVIEAMLPLLHGDTACGRLMANWPGVIVEDAMPLRLCGGFHYLHLSGREPRLAPIYAGQVAAQDQVDAIIAAVTRDHDAWLLPWFDGPPQTNEAGRSAGLMAGLLWLSRRVGPKFEVIEIGASAGINTMMERYAFDLGGTIAGPVDSPMRIAPEWRGPPPPQASVEIAAIRGCDLNPVDLTDPEAALRLKSYVWAENRHRLARVDVATAMACARKPLVEQADAAAWVERQLALPQPAATTRVLQHSIVWQYLPPETRSRIERAMQQAGARATMERPLAWVQLETNRVTFRHELRVRYWPGGEDAVLLAQAHAHGAWVEWYGERPPATT